MYDPWYLSATQSITRGLRRLSTSSFVALLCSTSPTLPPPSLPAFAGSLCHVSRSPLCVFLCSPYMPFFFFAPTTATYHLLSSQCLSASLFSHNSTDRGFSKTAKCFYMKGSFASHSWCGGGPACFHGGRGRCWCLRVTTVRLSSTLVPVGGTRAAGRYLMSNNLTLLNLDINKKYIYYASSRRFCS